MVTLGPDFLHFHLMFPHRPTLAGGTEGHMVFITKKRKGLLGKLLSKLILVVTYIVGTYFEKGDRLIFESIRFSMKAPVKADHAIIGFIRHTEAQPTCRLPWAVESQSQAGLRRKVVSLAALGEPEDGATGTSGGNEL